MQLCQHLRLHHCTDLHISVNKQEFEDVMQESYKQQVTYYMRRDSEQVLAYFCILSYAMAYRSTYVSPCFVYMEIETISLRVNQLLIIYMQVEY